MIIPKKHLQELFNLLLKIKDEKQMGAVLEDLLTPQELASIAERLQIIKALAKGKTQRDIARNLKSSIGKVSRGSRVLQFGRTKWITLLGL